MSNNEEWMGAAAAQDYVGRTDRQLRRWNTRQAEPCFEDRSQCYRNAGFNPVCGATQDFDIDAIHIIRSPIAFATAAGQGLV